MEQHARLLESDRWRLLFRGVELGEQGLRNGIGQRVIGHARCGREPLADDCDSVFHALPTRCGGVKTHGTTVCSPPGHLPRDRSILSSQAQPLAIIVELYVRASNSASPRLL